jgi:hypothetical protein
MTKKFIKLVLHTGLGNNLFQYLLAKILMAKHPLYEIITFSEKIKKCKLIYLKKLDVN